jgi:hypothetical protein
VIYLCIQSEYWQRTSAAWKNCPTPVQSTNPSCYLYRSMQDIYISLVLLPNMHNCIMLCLQVYGGYIHFSGVASQHPQPLLEIPSWLIRVNEPDVNGLVEELLLSLSSYLSMIVFGVRSESIDLQFSGFNSLYL